MSKAMRKSLKQKQKLYIKFPKSKNREDELIYKKYKNLTNYKKIQVKLLFKLIRKTQRQCKITMADLERNHRKSSEEKSVSTNNT